MSSGIRRLVAVGAVLAVAVAACAAGAVPAAAPAAAAAAPAATAPAAPAAAATPGPASAPEYWFDTWQIPQLWASGSRGQGITIAEIDTGVNAALPELTGRIVPGADFGEPGNGERDRDVSSFGHGSAMASIMVARPGLFGITGIAPDAKVMPIAVPLRGTIDASPDDHLAEAIRYAAAHGARIISMSLGSARTPAGTDDEPCPADEQNAIYYALSKGAVLLAAAGNTGRAGNAVEEPGVCLGVVAVAAVDRAGAVAGFSSRHRYVSLAAPGVNVPSLSRVPGTAFHGDGTSQATAITAAVMALVWSRYPTLSGRQLVTRVLATLDGHRASPSPGDGYGIVNAYRASTAVVAADAPNPVYAAVAPFLARYRAFAATPTTARSTARPATPRPPRASAPFGSFAVGAGPPAAGASVPAGLGLAAAGLLALIGLLAGAVSGRRRHRAVVAAGPVSQAPASQAPASQAPASEAAAGPDPVSAAPVSRAPASDASLPDAPAVLWREVAAPPGHEPDLGSG